VRAGFHVTAWQRGDKRRARSNIVMIGGFDPRVMQLPDTAFYSACRARNIVACPKPGSLVEP
jgi:hypothetical protein